MTFRRASLAALALAIACATIGDETNFPDVVQTSGVGPFRPLTDPEAGTRTSPDGRILDRAGAFGRAMVADDFLFYANAAVLAEVPDRQGELPEGDIDPLQIEPFAIHRGGRTPGEDGEEPPPVSFELGDAILTATETWEGAEVFDPWAVQDGSTARLYYAAAGGIGVAEASALGGSFTKVAGPVVEAARSPSVVTFAGERVMLFEATDTGTIGLATSSDGRAFTVVTRDLPLALAGDSELGAPGAVVAVTPTGREVLRVYFEVALADGVRIVTLAATEDLDRWDRLETGVLGAIEDARDPAPLLMDGDATVLIANAPHTSRSVQVRAIVGAVAPSNVVLAEEPAGDAM